MALAHDTHRGLPWASEMVPVTCCVSSPHVEELAEDRRPFWKGGQPDHAQLWHPAPSQYIVLSDGLL